MSLAMSSSVIPPATRSSTFDRLSFVKYMKNIGRQYRKQAMMLVSICRVFAQAQEQTFFSHDDLRRVLQVVDEALCSATEAQKGSSKEVGDKFKKAVDDLSNYEIRYHWHPGYREPTVAEKMKKAEENDKSSFKFLNRLKENFCSLEEGPTTTVEFHIHKSLPDQSPTIVKQVLCPRSGVNEILWNFSRYKEEESRLTLRQNVHFYQVLPTSPENYGGKFRFDPTESFLHEKISVLADNLGPKGRVFLETGKKKRAFGNVWAPKDAIIFKDVCGKLEGESIVGEAIQSTSKLWCSEKPPLSNTSRPSHSPTTNTTATTPPEVVLRGDWTGPIRQMLYSPSEVKNIHISDKPPTNSSPSRSAPSSPAPRSGPSSTGRTARSTPLLRQHPTGNGSPRSPAHPSPGPSSILPTRSMFTPAPSNAAPLPVPPPQRSPNAPQPQTRPATRRPTPLPQQLPVSPRSPAPLSSGPSSISPARPTPTLAPRTTPLPMSPPQQSPRPATARPTPPARQPSTAGVSPRSPAPPSLGTSATRPTATPVPTTAAPSPVPPLQSHTAASPLARQAVQASTSPLPDMSSRGVSQQGVQTAVLTQTRKKYWYQKCFDAVKNTLTPGSS